MRGGILKWNTIDTIFLYYIILYIILLGISRFPKNHRQLRILHVIVPKLINHHSGNKEVAHVPRNLKNTLRKMKNVLGDSSAD